jgi:hypothetical protein
VWFNEAAIAAWRAVPSTKPWHSPLAILTALTLRAVCRLALRQTEGSIGSAVCLLGLDLPVPDLTTLSRRADGLDVVTPAVQHRRRARASAGGHHGIEALRRRRVAA